MWLHPKSFKHSQRGSKWIWIADMLNELSNTLSCPGVGCKMRRLRTAVGSDAEMEWGGYAGDGSAHMHIYHWWQTRASVKNAYLWLRIPTGLISFTDLNALKMSKQINKSHKNQISVIDWMPFKKSRTTMWMLTQPFSPCVKDLLCYHTLIGGLENKNNKIKCFQNHIKILFKKKIMVDCHSHAHYLTMTSAYSCAQKFAYCTWEEFSRCVHE